MYLDRIRGTRAAAARTNEVGRSFIDNEMSEMDRILCPDARHETFGFHSQEVQLAMHFGRVSKAGPFAVP